MSDFTKRYLMVAVLLLVVGAITFGAYSTRDYSGVLYTQSIPMIVGDWYGREVPMDERTYEILETKDAIMREYTNSDNERVLLAIVFAADNRKVAHPPEVCFAGGGWSRTDKVVQTVTVENRTIEVNRLLLKKGANKQIVLYLYKAGGKLTPNYYSQQLNIILNGMLRRKTSSALIRVSSLADGDDVKGAMERTRKFTGEVIPVLEEYLP